MSEPADIEVACACCAGSGKVMITESGLRRREWKAARAASLAVNRGLDCGSHPVNKPQRIDTERK